VIVVAGESLVDLITSVEDGLTAVPGGGPFNTSRTIARLGVPCAFMGSVSTDRFGQRLRTALEGDGVDLDLVVTTDLPTTLAVAELDEHGAATYRFYLQATSAAALEEGDASLPPTGLTALHVGTLGLAMEPIGSTIEGLVRQLPDPALLMVDPNCRPGVIADREAYRRRMGSIVTRADIVKVSRDDLAFLEPSLKREAGARELLVAGVRVVLLTNGGRPVVVMTESRWFEVPVPDVEVVDTVGAGDAFGGAFLAWWIRNGLGRQDLGRADLLERAVTQAVEVAAITCQRAGADPPWLEELRTAG
jgi:fructokinase